MTTRYDDPHHERELDRVARALHAEAVAQLPTRTSEQLRSRRGRVRPAAARHAPALGWGLASTAAIAVFAVAFGLHIDPATSESVPDGRLAVLSGDAVEATESSYRQTYAALDEDPDFYLWLATIDVQPLAME